MLCFPSWHSKEKEGSSAMNSNILACMRSIASLLTTREETVSVAESCTGGLLGGALTELSGSSAYFLGGIQAYSNTIKSEVLGVKLDSLVSFGAVSQEVASEMAAGTRHLMGSDWAVSITGVAGPDGGTPDKPVGTVWIAIADHVCVRSQKLNLKGNRSDIRQGSVIYALEMLFENLSERDRAL